MMGPDMDDLVRENGNGIQIVWEPGLSIDRIFYYTQLAKLLHNIEIVVIDYAQLVGGQPSSMSTTDFLRNVANKCRVIANKLNVAVVLVSQLNRAPAMSGEEAGAHNLKGSGALEEVADIIMILDRMPGKETGSVRVVKHREGRTGKVDVLFDEKQLFFTEVS